MVPRSSALRTLLRGFDLGVNIVHTAPDYEGADDIVSEAVRRSRRRIIVCSQGYGEMSLFASLFERARQLFAPRHDGRLDLFGIACVDDRELLGENVWGSGGMVEYLQEKKRQGLLRGSFCTTHGRPEYIRKLITSGAFDAVMMAYNPLGFHLLSASLGKDRVESLPQNAGLFSIAAQHDVGVMLMKPLAGGLLCDGKAFHPHHSDSAAVKLRAQEILRYLLLTHPTVACVMPGTASPAEAEENASAACVPLELSPESVQTIQQRITALQASVCSRCGKCDELCSKGLPISWLFRAAYIDQRRSMTFETPRGHEYFELHPSDKLACQSCASVTCRCPVDIDIPATLAMQHQAMLELRRRGVLARRSPMPQRDEVLAAAVLRQEAFKSSGRTFLRVVVENVGSQPWIPARHQRIYLEAKLRGRTAKTPLQGDVPAGERCHFVFPVFNSEYQRLILTLVFVDSTAGTRRVPVASETAE